jgi:predicted flap endonuclease-1-like 5' DNA nuclease
MLDALSYLLLNSTLLISVLALVFFLLGLWLGRLIWGRYQREAHHSHAALLIAQADLNEAREQLTNSRQSAQASETQLAECRQALAERQEIEALAETQPEPTPADPDEVDDLIAELRKQLDKTGSDLEIARAEAMQLSDQLSEARHAANRLRGDNQRLNAELQRCQSARGTPDEATSPLPVADLPSRADTATPSARDTGNVSTTWDAFEADLTAGKARIDDTLGLVFDTPPTAADDLTKIKGIATVLNGKLNGFGIYTYRQIAGWDEEVVEEFSKRLSFKDRVQRDDWVGQAKKLHNDKYGEALG